MSQTPAQPRNASTGRRALLGGTQTAWRGVALLSFLVAAPAMVVGCFQELDNGAFGGGTGTGQQSQLGDNDLQQIPCPTGSKACFDLCGSPDCALLDAAIPPILQTPVIYQADGATTTLSCDQVEAESLAIRDRACGPCHGPASGHGQDSFNYIMDDPKLTTMQSNNFGPNDGGLYRMIVPGDTKDSWVYQRMLLGVSGTNNTGMPPPDSKIMGLIGPQAAATVVRPSPADVSVMYWWITQCLVDAGAAAPNYAQGAGYGPEGGAGH
jgi:hypothetical protein